MERKYYLIHDPGKSLEAINKWQIAYEVECRSAGRLVERFKAKEAVQVGRKIVGFQFDSDPGEGWIYVCDFLSYYKPDRRKKAGKEIAKIMELVRIPDSRDFADLIDGPGVVFHTGRCGSVSFEHFNARYVVSVPLGTDWIPPDSTPLKMSEYWALKEKAEAEKEN